MSALAVGGSNQSIFLIGALLASQGSAAIPLLVGGLLLAYAATPGWIELVLMWPNRVGGIAATCAEAFRPYSPVLANLTGVCYWWGWVPTGGVTALLSGAAIHTWYLPGVPTPVIAVAIVCAFTVVNLCGVRMVTRLAIPMAAASALLALLSGLLPIVFGRVDWHTATTFQLTLPFSGPFGAITSAMAGLYLVGFAAPAFEAAACHVGEMRDPERSLPRAMWASAGLASLYFVVLPIVWLGVFGAGPLHRDLTALLGPTLTPLLGMAAKSAAVWLLVFNMFHGSLQPLAGASRTLSQLSEDGLLPRTLARRSRTDCPWVATLFTAAMTIACLLVGDPVWLIAAANLTYLIGIGLPSVAVWLLRRNEPAMRRPFRAPRGTIILGVCAAGVWALSTVLGFEQFGLATALVGIALAYSGSAAYAWRRWQDARHSHRSWMTRRSIHVKLTGAMLAVLVLDGAGYLLAVTNLRAGDQNLAALCADIFIGVALLTIIVGLVLPGTIGQAVGQVAGAADGLANGALADLTEAMERLASGDLSPGPAMVDITPLKVFTRDELGHMATSFNTMQGEIVRAASALDSAREQLQHNRDRLEELAFHDPLTRLANRSLFADRVTHALARGERHHVECAVLLLDLDDFKTVNDSLGHAVGDELLVAVAKRLSSEVRPGDTAARLGGDEFALLLEDLSAPTDAMDVAQRLLESLRRPFTLQGRAIPVRASIGVALCDGFAADADAALRNADVAMYAAKAQGKGRCEMFSSSLHARATERLALEQDLDIALDQQQFRVVYQPQFAIRSGRLVGVEALVRWEHPRRGLLTPDKFIPGAEESGQIVLMDAWILEAACTQSAVWQAAGLPPIDISVNVSGRAFEQPAFASRVIEIVRASGLKPSLVELEITESAAVRQAGDALTMLAELRAFGLRIAIDDFGTGYSVLSRLQHFPLDRLKIDKKFIDEIRIASGDAPIVTAMIAMGHGLGLDVVAEGVETQEQLDFLRRHGCDVLQGYLASKPVDPAVVGQMLREGITLWARIESEVTGKLLRLA